MHGLALEETGLGVGSVGGRNGKRGELNGNWAQTCDGEGRQGAQDIGEKRGLSDKKRCKCTGTPTFGFPPVFYGPVALFMACVYAVFAPMILQMPPWWVLFQPWSQQ